MNRGISDKLKTDVNRLEAESRPEVGIGPAINLLGGINKRAVDPFLPYQRYIKFQRNPNHFEQRNIDYIMEPLAWPLAVVLICGLFMLMFRQPITSLIGRIRSISRKEILADRDTEALATQQAEATGAEELLEPFQNQSVLERERRINEELDRRGVEEPNERVRVLLRYLAANVLVLEFQQISRSIFSSQFSLLRFLNGQPDGATLETLEPFYQIAETAIPDLRHRYPPAEYVRFLVTHGLLLQQGERYFSTQLGKDFSAWMTTEGQNGIPGL